MILPRPPAVALAFAIVLVAPLAIAEEPPAPVPGLELSIGVPPTGPWTMVLKNEGTTPLRVAADARLLTLEVLSPPEPPAPPDPKHPRRASPVRGYPRGSLPACRMPGEMRPPDLAPERALVLLPGERYTEKFEPVSLCGASKAALDLGPGAIVYPSFGWAIPKHRATAKKGAPPPPPYVAEPLKLADPAPPVRLVEAAGIMLSPAKTPDEEAPVEPAVEPKVPIDEHAAKLVMKATPFADAHEAGDVGITVTLKNAGKRKTIVHLREDDLEVEVAMPGGGTASCAAGSDRRAVAREFFETLGPAAHRTLTVQLRERCPAGTFDRPGGYTLTPKLVLRERGEAWGLSAFVGTVAAPTPTRLRVRTGRLPYHAEPPRPDKQNREPAPSAD